MKRAILFCVLAVIVLLALSASLRAQTPNIVSVSPAQNQLNVPTDAIISVTFDTDMDSTSFSDSSFIAYGQLSGLMQGHFTYDSIERTVSLFPSDEFYVGELVTVELTNLIRSDDNIPLEAAFTWSFYAAVEGGSAFFNEYRVYAAGDGCSKILAADFDGDGSVDLATANGYSGSISILLNDGNAEFPTQVNYSVGQMPVHLCSADFDCDGSIDIVSVNHESNDISVFMGLGDGSFAPASFYSVSLGPVAATAADFDGDGDVDLAVVHYPGANLAFGQYSDSDVWILLNDGNGAFVVNSSFPVNSGSDFIYACDIDNDGDPDLTISDFSTNSVTAYQNGGNLLFSLYSVCDVLGREPNSIVGGDLDNDQDIDLVTANNRYDDASVLINDGNGAFTPYRLSYAGRNTRSACIADIDGDGDLDIALGCINDGTVSTFLNNGDGTFGSATIYPITRYAYVVAPADFDGDGDIDLAVGNGLHDVVTILFQCADDDSDDVCQDSDNCPTVFNPAQEDSDNDGVGDSCDVCPYHESNDCCNPTEGNLPPEVTSPEADTVMPGVEAFTYIAGASDPNCDGTELILSYFDFPAWCDTSGLVISGTVACDYQDTSFNVIAFDGELADTLVVNLVIDHSNQPPEILDTLSHVYAASQTSFTYYPSFLDPDDSAYTISYANIPHWCSVQNDSVVGLAPDTTFTELLTVSVQDYCNMDTYSFLVSIYFCGNADGRGTVDIDDVVFLINYIFAGGPEPEPIAAGDADCSGTIDIDDVVYLIAYIFSGGQEPCADCPQSH